eukprot:SAG31_NODE_13646_length_855_cov_1.933862_2_plen_180_part_01
MAQVCHERTCVEDNDFGTGPELRTFFSQPVGLIFMIFSLWNKYPCQNWPMGLLVVIIGFTEATRVGPAVKAAISECAMLFPGLALVGWKRMPTSRHSDLAYFPHRLGDPMFEEYDEFLAALFFQCCPAGILRARGITSAKELQETMVRTANNLLSRDRDVAAAMIEALTWASNGKASGSQ